MKQGMEYCLSVDLCVCILCCVQETPQTCVNSGSDSDSITKFKAQATS